LTTARLSYINDDVIELLETEEFVVWLSDLRDKVGRARIVDRLLRLKQGQFGDIRALGGGIQELRLHFGPGYRVYFCRREQDGLIVILLAGGDKSSQRRDVALAKQLAIRELAK
jgi:putative addiction module killer protein